MAGSGSGPRAAGGATRPAAVRAVRAVRDGGSGPRGSGGSGGSGGRGGSGGQGDGEEEAAAASRAPLLDRPLASYYLLLSSAGLLLLLGLVMVLSASSVRSYADFGSSYTLFIRQATWVGIGLPIVVLASRMPVRVFRALAYPLLGVTVFLLMVVLVPGIGSVRGGARQWIVVGPITIQPSELAKIALVLWCSDLLVRKRRRLSDPKHLFVPLVPAFLFIDLLMLLEPDLGGAICVTVVPLTILWVIGTPKRFYGAVLATMITAATILAVAEPYRLKRLLSFTDPFSDASGNGFQAVQGIYALSTGGWWGEGLGASREKWPELLPAVHTDFILAIIGEELGLVGSLVVVGLFGVMGYAGLRIAHRTDDLFVRLAAAGVTAWIIVQAVVNMGAVVGLLPITGVTLPLVSFGGSSLLPTLTALGMLLAFARSEPAAAQYLRRRAEERRAARAEPWRARARRVLPGARTRRPDLGLVPLRDDEDADPGEHGPAARRRGKATTGGDGRRGGETPASSVTTFVAGRGSRKGKIKKVSPAANSVASPGRTGRSERVSPGSAGRAGGAGLSTGRRDVSSS
ncbi:Cell division-specific peptidoglycan biosynthesis regulator FtsW [Frankia canadensis]|uniref:Probable peptidoglycan glycosyltransferase FtsW n=1 Tax=Frankia canadensis TaxID=1836972 RepID=A0A2I2KJ02_9ACTN|nr:putative lipid II flippase FtsW [Frankia canadensis]SNQ45649.1 Cell division-specific peptidoglycan biosynthesis regulator FtsW [Frankia canadensis]SOU52939.1 Cell division-specific peptidoglycan biosynthesis regulator FtsW [Frankia canadensis]